MRHACLCGEAHSPHQCARFPTPEARRMEAKRQRMCWKCFDKTHGSRSCTAMGPCPKCKEDHHASLCITSRSGLESTSSYNRRQNPPPNSTQQGAARVPFPSQANRFRQPTQRNNNQPRETNRVQTLHAAPVGNVTTESERPVSGQCVLQMASALIFNEANEEYQPITILLDSGAQRSFIKTETRDKLKLPTMSSISFTTTGMGELQETFNSHEVKVTLKGLHSFRKLQRLSVFTKEKLTSTTKTALLSEADKSFIKREKIMVAQQSLRPSEVSPDLLIGQDLLNQVIEHYNPVMKLPSGLVLTPTVFGYTISGASGTFGPMNENGDTQCSSLIVATPVTLSNDNYKKDIKHLYELESLGINTQNDTDEAAVIKFMDNYRKTIVIENGNITAGFPFTDEHIEGSESDIAQELSRSLYVDNVLLEGTSAEDLLHKYAESKKLFSSVGMNLRDYLSNSPNVNKRIPEADRTATTEVKVLGILWNSVEDTISLKCCEKRFDKISKRTIKSYISGFEITLPRKVAEKSPNNTMSVFVDSSKRAYACCIYVTSTTNKGTSESRLFTAKSKIAPIKKEQTIPRLELLSIFIGLSLAESTIQKTNMEFKQINIFSDSTIALCWIQGTRRLPSIVTTLVQKISLIWKRLQESSSVSFFHVPTQENIADCATRGVIKDNFVNHRWWCGPIWLNMPAKKWPVKNADELYEQNPDSEEIHSCAANTVTTTVIWPTENISNYLKLIRIVAYSARFIRKITKGKCLPLSTTGLQTNAISVEEVVQAEKLIIRQEQAVYGSALLTQNKQINVKADKDGIYRKFGRLENAELSFSAANPVESVVNSRPLTTIGDQDTPCEALRPIDFIYKDVRHGTTQLTSEDHDGDPDFQVLPELPSQKAAKLAISATEKLTKNHWKEDQDHLDQQPRIGDVVLLDDDSQLSRGQWPMALITDLITSRDGEIRSAMLQTSTGRIVHRPINRLIPLEIHSSTRSSDDQTDESSTIAKRTRKKTSSRTAKEAGVVTRQQPPRASKNQVSYNGSRNEPKSSKSSSSTLLMIAMCSLALLNSASAAAISCSNKGAKINTTLSAKAELCINYKECTVIPADANITEVAFPFEHLVSQHTIQWRTIVDSRQYTETIVCPPGDVCQRNQLHHMHRIFWEPSLRSSWKRRGRISLQARIPTQQPKESFTMTRLSTLPASSKMIIFSIVMVHLIAIGETCQYTHTLNANNTVCSRSSYKTDCRDVQEATITPEPKETSSLLSPSEREPNNR
ncbi:Tas retrotransposon peptidase A16 [Ostertagia ostertagi]